MNDPATKLLDTIVKDTYELSFEEVIKLYKPKKSCNKCIGRGFDGIDATPGGPPGVKILCGCLKTPRVVCYNTSAKTYVFKVSPEKDKT